MSLSVADCSTNVHEGRACSEATPPSTQLTYRGEIDGLRAVAVLGVVIYHLFPGTLSGGFAGVDVFFILSGFLISRIIWDDLIQGRFSIREFYSRRIRRIFPALIVVLASSWLAGLAVLYWDDFAKLGRHIVAGALFVVNFALWREGGYFDVAAEQKPLLHLWSLSIEEQFYLLWPLVLWMIGFRRNRIVSLLVLVGVGSFAANLYIAGTTPSDIFYNPLCRAWELVLGASVGFRLMVAGPLSLAASRFIAPVGMLSILGSFMMLDGEMIFPGWRALPATLGTAMLILSHPETWLHRRLLRAAPCVAVGLISYPLYLWHWPLLSFSIIRLGSDVSVMVRWAIFLGSFALAWLTFRYVERPIRHGPKRAWLPIALGAMIAMLGGVGACTLYSRGFASWAPANTVAPYVVNPPTIEEWFKVVRSGECHLQDAAASEHAKVCIQKKRPMVLLWGDSHGSALYPGLAALQQTHEFGLTQFTQAGCPPLPDVPSELMRHCADINRRIVGQIGELQPDVLVIHAAWLYHLYPLSDEVLQAKIEATLQNVRAANPAGKIVLVGPGPRWSLPLPKMLAALMDQTGEVPPRYAMLEDVPEITRLLKLDVDMERLAAARGVEYVSLMKILCEQRECLTRIGELRDDLMIFDESHLTVAGSKYVASHLVDTISPASLNFKKNE